MVTRFRQAVLVLLLSLLCGGPALAALPQAGCATGGATGSATCPMCVHGAEPMHCSGEQRMHIHASPQHRVDGNVVALQAPEMACVCAAPPAPQTVEARVSSRLADKAIAPVLPVEELWWPPAQTRLADAALASLAGPKVFRANTALPLRL